MKTEKEATDFNQIEAVELYRFLQKQPVATVVNYWLYEFIEKKKALSFIQSRGLYAEYTESKPV